MRAKYAIIFTLIAILFSAVFCTNASAMTTGFDISNIPAEDAERCLGNININYESEEYNYHSIKCFDISDSGLIGIGIDEFDEKHINIYDNNGVFQYGYSFEDNGTFGVEFDSDNLIIYFALGDIACLIDKDGNLIEMGKIPHTFENNNYWNHNVFAKTKDFDGDKYILSTALMFSPSYSKLTKISPDGTETVIIDVSTDSIIYLIIVLVIGLIIIGIVVLGLFIRFKPD